MDDETFSGFWNHVEDLRKTLLRIFWIILAGILPALYFYPLIFQFFAPAFHPSDQTIKEIVHYHRISNPTEQIVLFQLPNNSKALTPDSIFNREKKAYEIEPGKYLDYEMTISNQRLLILNPLGGFMLTLKVCFWVSFVLTSPLWIVVLLQFIFPALKKSEKQMAVPFVIYSFLFMFGGIAIAYFFTLPWANQYLESFNAEIGINAWSLTEYLTYTLFLFLGHAIAVEICLILIFLVHYRKISSHWLIEKRRPMIVAAFVLGAILTPPDVASQLMFAIPLICVYEIAILYGKLRKEPKDLFGSNVN